MKKVFGATIYCLGAFLAVLGGAMALSGVVGVILGEFHGRAYAMMEVILGCSIACTGVLLVRAANRLMTREVPAELEQMKDDMP